MALPPNLKIEIFLTIGNYRLIADMTEVVHHCALLRHISQGRIAPLAVAMPPTPIVDADTAADRLRNYLAHFSAKRIKNLADGDFSSHFPGLEIHRIQGRLAHEIINWYLVTDQMARELDREKQPLLTIPSTAIDPRDKDTAAHSTLWGRLDTGTPLLEDPTILKIFDTIRLFSSCHLRPYPPYKNAH